MKPLSGLSVPGVQGVGQASGRLAERQSTPEGRRPDAAFDCIYLSSSERDFLTVSQLVEPAGIHVHHAALLGEADSLLAMTGAPVLMSDMAFPDGSWTDAKALLERSHGRVALVLSVDDAQAGLWIDLLERGVYDLVLRPFAGNEVRRILENARAHAQYGGRVARTA